MPNPKITLSMTFDPDVMDVLKRLAAAMERYCDTVNGAPAPAEKVEEPIPAEPVTTTPVRVIEAPVAPQPMQSINPNVLGPNGIDMTAGAAPSTAPTTVVFSPFDHLHPAQQVPGANPFIPATPPVPVAMPISQQPPQQPATTMPVVTADMTFDKLSAAGVELMGKGIDASAVLREFGVVELSAVPKEKYPALAARFRQLGANI